MFTSLAATATAVLAPMIATRPRPLAEAHWRFCRHHLCRLDDRQPRRRRFRRAFWRYPGVAGMRAHVRRVACCRVRRRAPPSPLVVLLALAPLVLGLGYGPITPASSHVLIRTAPPSRMALTFSIKQTGVPAGAALAGALLPGLALVQGWRATYLAIAALGIVLAFAAQPTRRELDADRQPARRFRSPACSRRCESCSARRALTELALTGFVYAATQVCLASFLVIYLTETLASGSSPPVSRSPSPTSAASSAASFGAAPPTAWCPRACSWD